MTGYELGLSKTAAIHKEAFGGALISAGLRGLGSLFTKAAPTIGKGITGAGRVAARATTGAPGAGPGVMNTMSRKLGVFGRTAKHGLGTTGKKLSSWGSADSPFAPQIKKWGDRAGYVGAAGLAATGLHSAFSSPDPNSDQNTY